MQKRRYRRRALTIVKNDFHDFYHDAFPIVNKNQYFLKAILFKAARYGRQQGGCAIEPPSYCERARTNHLRLPLREDFPLEPP